jgi:hypothetical protein
MMRLIFFFQELEHIQQEQLQIILIYRILKELQYKIEQVEYLQQQALF